MFIGRILFLACLLCSLAFSAQASNQRDYCYRGDGHQLSLAPDDWELDETGEESAVYWIESNQLCLDCFFLVTSNWWSDLFFNSNNHHGIEFQYIPIVPAVWIEDLCQCECYRSYSGYLHFLYRGDFPFLKKQIAYSAKCSAAKSFWPENSSEAMQISNHAVGLFRRLFQTTTLNKVAVDPCLAKKFMVSSWYFDTLEDVAPIAMCATCFHFSDYFQVCQDIKAFAKRNFTQAEVAPIEAQLIQVLDRLAPMFRNMYQNVLSVTAMPEVQAELELIEDLYNDWEMDSLKCPACSASYKSMDVTQDESIMDLGALESIYAAPRAPKGTGLGISQSMREMALPGESTAPPAWCLSPQYLARGMLYNDHGLFVEAIKILSKAIELDPSSSDAYLERAHAYFECGQYNLALADYNGVVVRTSRPQPLSSLDFAWKDRDVVAMGGLDYSHGLCLGVLDGAHASVEEFGPVLVSSTKGLLQGLWAFACSPAQVSHELIDASIALVEAIRSQSGWESVQMMVPELRDLCRDWDLLSDHHRGRKIGYIIGKYGVDIFIPVAGTKLYQQYRALKAANTAFTLECMTKSVTQQQAIIAESAVKAAQRAQLAEATLSGKLVLKNAAQADHIITQAHHWDLAISLTGDVHEDCRRAIQFLEQHNVVQGKPWKTVNHPNPSPDWITGHYKKQIGDIQVEVVMQTRVLSGETTVQNAWVTDPRRPL